MFITIAFAGSVPDLGSLILAQWIFKTLYEIVATPLTYLVVNALKRAEGIDTFDYDTDFSPVSVA